MADNPLRDLPAVDVLADEISVDLPRPLAVAIAREVLDGAREAIKDGSHPDVVSDAQRVASMMARSSGVEVLNASGVLLHTNLGRARWSEKAVRRAQEVASVNTNLEMDLESGDRGRRGSYVTRLLALATGADGALVVNNNASALVLALAATASRKSTVVARGELIEIGGSYRLPDVLAASGTNLVEVGTTNRSRLGDYQTAIQLYDVGAILKVHPSNYRIDGFTEEATIGDLAGLKSDAVLIHDIGSGLLDAEAGWLPDWLSGEPGAKQSLAAGADLVMFSGDKLLGGPQAGVIVGDATVVGRLRSHPLARALRVDAVTYAALGATLESYLSDKPTDIPFWRQALAPRDELTHRSQRVAAAIGAAVEMGASTVGGGSAPGILIDGPVVKILGRDDLFQPLLEGRVPVLTRRDRGHLVIDLRAVDADTDLLIIDAVLQCL